MRDDQYEKAKKRVEEKKKFYKGLSTYLVMSIFFYILNQVTYSGSWWYYWPMMGWGIGILLQYFKLFGIPGLMPVEGDWEEKELEKELSRMRQKDRTYQDSGEADDYLDLREAEPQKRGWRDDELV